MCMCMCMRAPLHTLFRNCNCAVPFSRRVFRAASLHGKLKMLFPFCESGWRTACVEDKAAFCILIWLTDQITPQFVVTKLLSGGWRGAVAGAAETHRGTRQICSQGACQPSLGNFTHSWLTLLSVNTFPRWVSCLCVGFCGRCEEDPCKVPRPVRINFRYPREGLPWWSSG